MKTLLVASGGGHTGYAIAVAEQLIKTIKVPVENIIFLMPRNDVWSLMRIRKRIGRVRVYQALKPRKPNEPAKKIIEGLPIALRDSWRIVKNVDIVLCTGSNHSIAPAILAKIYEKIPVICIEAVDRIVSTSKTVRILYKYFNIPVAIHWNEQKRNYPKGILVGPVYEEPIYKPTNKGYILVTTGSMGHRKLFNLLLRTSLENIVIQTGRIDPNIIKKHKPKWVVFRFEPDIDKWIAGASLVITHQGLTAVEASLAYRKPVIIAYNPDLPMTSGFYDSVHLASKINALMIDPRKITSRQLERVILEATGKKPPRIRNGAIKLAFLIRKIMKNIDLLVE